MAGWGLSGSRPLRTGLSAAIIGWGDAGRRAHLHRVVGLCRFLIRPGVECRNLASHVLGGVVRRVGDDFEARYGYRPSGDLCRPAWGDEFSGSRLGWRDRRPGTTGPRGNGDAEGRICLDADWRARIPEPCAPLAPLEVGAGRENWAEQEFGGAPLGDARLSARLVTCARHQAEAPMRAFTGAARGDKALAYYRFIDKPDNEAVTVENILQPHRHQTLRAG